MASANGRDVNTPQQSKNLGTLLHRNPKQEEAISKRMFVYYRQCDRHTTCQLSEAAQRLSSSQGRLEK
jgi:hypothetical protein